MIVTIDGPSGTGKSTVARKVAAKLHFVYFDTGAMYRAFTWLVLRQNIDIENNTSVLECLQNFDFKITDQDGNKHYFVNQEDVTEAIRSRDVTQFVSAVSALYAVRSHLLDFQHQFAKKHSAVFEGRDLGTVVFPNAEAKFFLDADPNVRAQRRLNEILIKNPDALKGLTHKEMLEDILRRDQFDSTREIAPLRCPIDAHKIDTTNLSIDQVVDEIVNEIKKR